jgi:monovalent cation:H+ antiporter-2, CPA2 family
MKGSRGALSLFLVAAVAICSSVSAKPFLVSQKAIRPQVLPLLLQRIPRGGELEGSASVEGHGAHQEQVKPVVSTPTPAVDKESAAALMQVMSIVTTALANLKKYIHGPKGDTLLLLATTALNTPICKKLGASPILGFLVLGILFGPNGKGLVQDIHTTELLADLGVVFFLFEMGIHLNFDTLMSMRKDVFGLGGSQFAITALAVAGVAKLCGLSTAAMVVLGGGLALSSSAFVLQLLKDKDQLGTKFGKSSFGVLLLQDLMVVPLLVVTPLLAGGGESLGKALATAGVQATMALTAIAIAGKFFMNPVYDFVAGAKSQEAFVGLILATVLGMSFLTEGLGLSNTLGAFLAGVLLSDSKHCHDIEREVSPFRGILVGLFFFSVGFEIDLPLIMSKPALIFSIVAGIVGAKALIAGVVCLVFGLDLSIAQRAGLILSQGGEFAFVAFRLARSLGILDADTTKLMLTCVALTMAVTPFMEDMGAKIAENMDEKKALEAKKDAPAGFNPFQKKTA